MYTLYCDTRQQSGKHTLKERWWESHGVPTIVQTLPVGDYMRDGSNIIVDTKRDVDEIAQNVGRDHKRFIRECLKARDAGCRLIFLIEDGRYIDRSALAKWTNSHCVKCPRKFKSHCLPKRPGKCIRHGTRKPVQGPELLRKLMTIEAKYGCRFEFCKKTDTARRVCELLGYDMKEVLDASDV